MSVNQQIENWLVSRKKSFLHSNRPFITLAFAQTLDGSITTDQGDTLALSGLASNRITHQLRSLHDGILIGIKTVISDDPQLTVREWQGENPQPIVLDSQLRMPAGAKLCAHPDKRCWVLTLQNQESENSNADIDIFRIAENGADFVPLDSAMKLLREKSIHSLMVEGGARVITEFLKAGLADAIVMTIAPGLLGGYRAVGDLEQTLASSLPLVSPMFAEKLEQDLLIWGDLHYGENKP